MAETTIPDVYIDVRPEGLIVPARIGVGRMGVVGTASKGPVGQALTLASFPEARAVFGEYDPWDGGNAKLTLVRALELAFANGATTVLAVRVAGAGAASASYPVLANTDVVATLQALSPGTWGNALQVQVTAAQDSPYIRDEVHTGSQLTLFHKPVADSVRNRISVVKEGTALPLPFTVTAAAPAAGEVRLEPDGKLTFVASEAPKAADKIYASYLVDKGVASTVTVRYRTPTRLFEETYTVVDGNDLVAQVRSGSQLVRGEKGAEPAKLPTPTNDFASFSGGNDGAVPAPNYTTGLEKLLGVEAHIIVAAGQDESFADELAAHCAEASTDARKRDRIAVVGSGAQETFDKVLGHPVDSDRVIFVAPGIRATDGAVEPPVDVTLPGSYAAAAVAGLIAGLPAHVSPTNKPLRVGGVELEYTSAQLAQLIQARVLALESRRGPRVVKGITTATNTAWAQITTRRIVDYAKYGVRSACEPYIGLLNNSRVRAALRTTINSFLAEMVNAEMLVGYSLDVTATRDEERQGIARVTLTLRPVFTIDYIQVTMFLE